MEELGQELVGHTFDAAEAGLRAGYAYAKAETGEAFLEPPVAQPALQPSPVILSSNLLNTGETRWTKASLKAQFTDLNTAYRHLREVHGIKLSKRSWEGIINAFNGVSHSSKSLEQRVQQLEQKVVSQEERIAVLEAKIHQILNSSILPGP
ncbi:MAG: hypothetical protein HC825_10900 [Oscillatoriales cyanobacterium RM1_1_9]|nr:hypothetical protein [Oscillatoriales cyanobacterium RM1_1_9]